jgi:hypothetical protein
MIGRRSMCLALAAALSAACSHPTVPEWEERAHEGFEQYQRSYFAGDRTADRDFRKAADALATTGKPELRARGELIGCALATAALDFERCNAWQSLQADADQADRAYGALLSGRFSGLDAKALPAQYGALAKATDAAARNDALKRIEDPLSRRSEPAPCFAPGTCHPRVWRSRSTRHPSKAGAGPCSRGWVLRPGWLRLRATRRRWPASANGSMSSRRPLVSAGS